jgi:two-component system, OmpR family, sensor kinase
MSLRLRLLLTLVPLFVICLAAADIGTYTALRSSLVSAVDTQLFNARQPIEGLLEGHDFGGGPGGPQDYPQYTYGALYDSSGALLSAKPFVFGTGTTSAKPVLPSPLPLNQYVDVPGTGGISSYRMYVGPAVDHTTNILLVAIPLDNVNATLNRLLFLELSISGGITLVVVLATWLLVRRGLRPLEHMATTARSIVATDLSKRVDPSTDSTEVGRLGLALNSMLTQLEAAFAERQRNEQRLRHFISDASHELRTPLTSMQGYAELVQRAPEMERSDLLLAMRRMEDETKRMGVLVDDLLLLARLDQGRPLQQDSVDLEALVRDASADASVADPGRVVTAAVSAPLVVTGDDMRLRQVLANLVHNALVHTPPGSPVELALHADAGSNDAVIEVIDHGTGIPDGHAQRIFERFHRADPERSGDRGGSGLGLSIVSAVVAAHHGAVSVAATPGGGATFTVRLPLAKAAQIPVEHSNF